MDISISSLLARVKERDIKLDYKIEKEYNPMEIFYNKVSEKEVCHNAIIADLLNPKGKHQCDSAFLCNFMSFINCTTYDEREMKVITERSVERVKTSGEGKRRIDILLEWNEGTNKNAIIIESKLNNANFQESQIEDYQAALEQEQYNIVSCVVLSDNILKNEQSDYHYFYCKDLVRWIDDTTKQLEYNKKSVIEKQLNNYLSILKQKIYKTDMRETANKILKMPDEELIKIKHLVDSFNSYLIKARIDETKENIKEFLPRNPSYSFEEPDNGYCLQIKEEDPKEGNGLIVEVYYFDGNPESERYGKNTEIWIKNSNTSKYIVNFSNIEYLQDFIQDTKEKEYYYNKNEEAFVFNYLEKESRTKMYEEIIRLLGHLSSYKRE